MAVASHHLPSVSTRGLKVGEWLKEKSRRYAGGYGARKYRQSQAKLRREAKMTASMKASSVAAVRRERENRAPHWVRRLITRVRGQR